jgi:hypothetical protein
LQKVKKFVPKPWRVTPALLNTDKVSKRSSSYPDSGAFTKVYLIWVFLSEKGGEVLDVFGF